MFILMPTSLSRASLANVSYSLNANWAFILNEPISTRAKISRYLQWKPGGTKTETLWWLKQVLHVKILKDELFKFI